MVTDRRSFLAAFATAPAAVAARKDQLQTRTIPVLVELFTSQGCSSCPPADALLARLVEEQPISGVEVIGLSEHVDYWDRLGWKDPYSSSVNTDRQVRYRSIFQTDSVYTPQMVVDGKHQLVGSDVRQAMMAIRESAKVPKLFPQINLDGQRATIIFPKRDGSVSADLLVALVQSEAGNPVPRGENHGKTLRHRNVVHNLVRTGTVNLAKESQSTVTLPSLPKGAIGGWRVVVFLQEAKSLRVLGASSVALKL